MGWKTRAQCEKEDKETKIREKKAVTGAVLRLLPKQATILVADEIEMLDVSVIKKQHRVLQIITMRDFSLLEYGEYEEIDYNSIGRIDMFIMKSWKIFHSSPPTILHGYKAAHELIEKVLDKIYPDIIKISVGYRWSIVTEVYDLWTLQKTVVDKVILNTGEILDANNAKKKEEINMNGRYQDPLILLEESFDLGRQSKTHQRNCSSVTSSQEEKQNKDADFSVENGNLEVIEKEYTIRPGRFPGSIRFEY